MSTVFAVWLTIHTATNTNMYALLYLYGFKRYRGAGIRQETLVIKNVSNCVYLTDMPQNIVNYVKFNKLFDNFSENSSIFQIIVL